MDQPGGFPEMSLSEPGSDSAVLANEPGDYLDARAANAYWNITVEECR